MAKLWAQMQAEDAGLPDITTLPLPQARRLFEDLNARWSSPDVEDRCSVSALTIPAAATRRHATHSGIGALRIEPRVGGQGRSRGTVLYLHGGGWVVGSPQTHRHVMARLACDSGCAVVGVDYGLAPEAPFPQGLQDCLEAWRWLRGQGADQDLPWFIAGDSAGANLALALMLELRAAREPLPDAALLFYGVYSADHGTASHRACGDGSYGLSSVKMDWYRRHYLAGGQGVAEDPLVSPLCADLSRLPPLWLSGAELDPLFDDSVAMAAKLASTDAQFEFCRYAGVVHGFMQMGNRLAEARLAVQAAARFLQKFQPSVPAG